MRTFRMKLSIFMILASVMVAAGPVLSDDENGEHQSIESVMQDIRQSQGVDSNDQIDCEKVSNEQFERLGEAYMDIMHPNPKEHAIMDRMMGGDNSESLATMHRIMGARYLGCYKGGVMGNYGPGMMDGDIMAGQRYGPWEVVHNHPGWNTRNPWIAGWPVWIILLVSIIIIIYALLKNKKTADVQSYESPLDVLRKRYAAGEISKEEYERMKKDLM